MSVKVLENRVLDSNTHKNRFSRNPSGAIRKFRSKGISSRSRTAWPKCCRPAPFAKRRFTREVEFVDYWRRSTGARTLPEPRVAF